MTTIEFPAAAPAAPSETASPVVSARAAAATAVIAVLLAALIVLDVALLGMDAAAVFGSCLTLALIAAGYAFRARFRG
ncbi:hypothetical protein [Bifidobacterium avesanii]|uniref:hypothetical protein n=1 Tax=Bifidobacterium avesanii TaxID=1798157 RepID=UPI0013855263|nr:hypothetical protein [Bifidobacterium avesanii]KAB8287152.1 hypothetical protein DSM100685_1946 [Bifidobacterium avesanii]